MANSNSALKISQGYGFKPGFGHFWAPGSNPSFWAPVEVLGVHGPMGTPGGLSKSKFSQANFDQSILVFLGFLDSPRSSGGSSEFPEAPLGGSLDAWLRKGAPFANLHFPKVFVIAMRKTWVLIQSFQKMWALGLPGPLGAPRGI